MLQVRDDVQGAFETLVDRYQHRLLGVLAHPEQQGGQQRRHFLATCGEAVVDPGRYDCLGLPMDEAVAVEGFEGLGEHLFTDAWARRRNSLHRCGPSASATRISTPHLLVT